MCLYIKKNTDANIAEKDILVFKCLDYRCGEYATSFRYYPIRFDSGNKTELSAEIQKGDKQYVDGEYFDTILAGIHAYRNLGYATLIAYSYNMLFNTNVHYAIIPKGTKYYIGEHEDIVAERMIIFKNKKDYFKNLEEKLVEL